MKIAILYGTETGNAEMLAEDIAAHLADHEVQVTNLSDFAPDAFDADNFYILVTSTYGDGDLPASAIPFGEKMADTQPDLSSITFAVFGMGDSEYPETYNFGGKRLEELMTSAGAQQVGERITHDASGSDMPEDLALPWAEDVVRQMEARREEAA
jgi:MioC protein